MPDTKNLSIYEAHRQPPEGALKPIEAGRLRGMTDINPMWRIKALTEEFGPCGIGWYYTVDKQWIEPCDIESVAFVNISLFVKHDGEWSKPINGTGGSKIIAQERNGKYVSDEAFKMATTDAISVACKQLGIGADIYFANDATKYTEAQPQAPTEAQLNQEMIESVDQDMVPHGEGVTPSRLAKLKAEMERTGVTEETILSTAMVKSYEEMSEKIYIAIMNKLYKSKDKA